MIICDTVKTLLENEKPLFIRALQILLKIANNILGNPNDAKYRRINLSSEATAKYLIPAVGALEVLFLMGFEEGGDRLVLAERADMEVVTLYRDQLEQLGRENIGEQLGRQSIGANNEELEPKRSGEAASKQSESESQSEGEALKERRPAEACRDERPPLNVEMMAETETKLKQELVQQFEQVLAFESATLQAEALDALPALPDLRTKAEARRMAAHEHGLAMDAQFCLLLETMRWFKEEFFTWFDAGFCATCRAPMRHVANVDADGSERQFGCQRVELFKCQICGATERFPRYFHPGQLLRTRRGRCMEWASCFCLICRALQIDVRFVWDVTDHVWAEAFDAVRGRWVHVDPCEGKADAPLIYERGWRKRLSYVFAFSAHEVVDCVWRYSTIHRTVRSRRNRCRESWLAVTLHALNRRRQESLPEERQQFLRLRWIQEMASFFSIPKINDESFEGRASGSLAWRLARGETAVADEDEDQPGFVFRASTEEEVEVKRLAVRYSASNDEYERHFLEEEEESKEEKATPNVRATRLRGWRSGAFESRGVFRKHERDWHKVYLCRCEGVCEGRICWRFEWQSAEAARVRVRCRHAHFESGEVQWRVAVGDTAYFEGGPDGSVSVSGADVPSDARSVSV